MSCRFWRSTGFTDPSISAPVRRQPGDFDVEPAWATEAALDQERMVDVASEGSIIVLGSPTRPGAC